MNPQKRTRIIVVYIVMVGVVVLVSFVLEHVLLGLPFWFVLILTGLSMIAVTVGTLLAIRRK